MSQNNYPKDDKLWLVKWIDRIKGPYLTTTSASVSVFLQELSITDPKQIHALRRKAIDDILRPSIEPTYLVVEKLVGSLPDIELGSVIQNEKRVAQLPYISRSLTIPLAELSCQSRALAENDQAPYRHWDSKLPFRVLNRYEYLMDFKAFSQSQCLTFKTDLTHYIIPRAIIFKTFYAPNYLFARAFTNGRWPEQCKTLVCTKELASGLKTGVDPDTGEWNVVRQLNVPKELIPWLGIYLFDEYGKACAASIYSSIFKARHPDATRGWFIDAKIPFVTTPEKPFQLKVHGFSLRKFSGAEKDSPERFLVTRIIAASLPALPKINGSSIINGQQGETQVKVDEPAPFANPPRTKPINAQTQISDRSDSNPQGGSTEIYGESFSIIDPPVVHLLQKASSKSYDKTPKRRDSDGNNGDIVSPGNNTYSDTAAAEAKIKALIRPANKRFSDLITALDALQTNKDIEGYTVFEPLERTCSIGLGGLRCWNFLDEEARVGGEWPKRSWRMAKPAVTVGQGEPNVGIPRACLVLKLEVTEGVFGYWIEIENTSTSYRSPYVANVVGDEHVLIAHLIEIIARHSAKDLVPNLTDGVREIAGNDAAIIRAYKHWYDDGKISSLSILRFLNRCHSVPNDSTQVA